MRTFVRWAWEQWCHAAPMTPGPPPVVVEVVVPAAWVAEVVAGAEALCAQAAMAVA